MTQQNGLTDDIGRVLKLGGDYRTHYGIECQLGRIAVAQAARGYKTDTLERMVEAQGRRHQARHDLLEIIPALAVRLEDAGHDVRDLLRFLHRIDGGGGPAAAGKVWEDLKVELQRVMLLSRRTPKPKPESPKGGKGRWEVEAMMLRQEHPDWTDAKIANDPKVGVSPSQLTRSDGYQRAKAEAHRRRRMPEGFGRSGSVEAIAPGNDAD